MTLDDVAHLSNCSSMKIAVVLLFVQTLPSRPEEYHIFCQVHGHATQCLYRHFIHLWTGWLGSFRCCEIVLSCSFEQGHGERFRNVYVMFLLIEVKSLGTADFWENYHSVFLPLMGKDQWPEGWCVQFEALYLSSGSVISHFDCSSWEWAWLFWLTMICKSWLHDFWSSWNLASSRSSCFPYRCCVFQGPTCSTEVLSFKRHLETSLLALWKPMSIRS